MKANKDKKKKKKSLGERKKTTRHFPLSVEFILCWDNEICLTIPLPQVNWPPVTPWPNPPALQPPLFCRGPTDNDDVTAEMLLGNRVSDDSVREL